MSSGDTRRVALALPRHGLDGLEQTLDGLGGVGIERDGAGLLVSRQGFLCGQLSL